MPPPDHRAATGDHCRVLSSSPDLAPPATEFSCKSVDGYVLMAKSERPAGKIGSSSMGIKEVHNVTRTAMNNQ